MIETITLIVTALSTLAYILWKIYQYYSATPKFNIDIHNSEVIQERGNKNPLKVFLRFSIKGELKNNSQHSTNISGVFLKCSSNELIEKLEFSDKSLKENANRLIHDQTIDSKNVKLRAKTGKEDESYPIEINKFDRLEFEFYEKFRIGEELEISNSKIRGNLIIKTYKDIQKEICLNLNRCR